MSLQKHKNRGTCWSLSCYWTLKWRRRDEKQQLLCSLIAFNRNTFTGECQCWNVCVCQSEFVHLDMRQIRKHKATVYSLNAAFKWIHLSHLEHITLNTLSRGTTLAAVFVLAATKTTQLLQGCLSPLLTFQLTSTKTRKTSLCSPLFQIFHFAQYQLC